MSIISDGLSNIYSLTSQINALKDQADGSATTNPEETLLVLQQNFNKMLDELISSSDDDQDKESSLLSYLDNETGSQKTASNTTDISQYLLQYNQFTTNLDGLTAADSLSI